MENKVKTNESKRDDRLQRAAIIRSDAKKLQRQIRKDYDRYTKDNGGWPAATKIQNVKQTNTAIGRIFKEHDRNVHTGLTFDAKKETEVTDPPKNGV